MSHTAASASSPAIPRWTDDEHNILVDAANDQIDLEREDESQEVSWSTLWQRISNLLRAQNYNRTPAACGCYWKRIMENEKVTAAEPRWDDLEDRILVTMTEAQLEREAADPELVISWPTLWRRVSQRLKDEGYSRSSYACEAYWIAVQNNHGDTSKSVNTSTGDFPEDRDEMNIDTSDDDIPAQISNREQPWSEAEHQKLTKYRQMVITKHGKQYGPDELPEDVLWDVVAKFLREDGYERTSEACAKHWRCQKRPQTLRQVHLDAPDPGADDLISTSPNHSDTSSPWSPMPELDDSHVDHGGPILDDPTTIITERAMPRAQMFTSDSRESSPERRLVITLVVSPDFLRNLAAESSNIDSETSRVSSKSVQKEKEAGTTAGATDQQSPNLARKMSRPRPRFSNDDRLFLEREAIQNGSYPNVIRREELARELNVEEPTIKNWFTQFRSVRGKEKFAARNSAFDPNRRGSSSSTETASSVLATAKRTHDSINTLEMSSAGGAGFPNNEPPAKMRRIEINPVSTESRQDHNDINSETPRITYHRPSFVEVSDYSDSDRETPPIPTATIPTPQPSFVPQASHPQTPHMPTNNFQFVPPSMPAPGTFVGNHGLPMDNETASRPQEHFSATVPPPVPPPVQPPVQPLNPIPHPTPPEIATPHERIAVPSIPQVSIANTTQPRHTVASTSVSTLGPVLRQNSLPMTPGLTPGHASEKEEAAWTASKIQTLRAAVTSLEESNLSHSKLIRKLELASQDTDHQRNKLHQNAVARIEQRDRIKDEEIAQAIKAIEEKNKREIAHIKEQCERATRDLEVRKEKLEKEKTGISKKLKRNEAELSRNKIGILGFERVSQYYNSVGGDENDEDNS